MSAAMGMYKHNMNSYTSSYQALWMHDSPHDSPDECIYNAFWLLGSLKVLPNSLCVVYTVYNRALLNAQEFHSIECEILCSVIDSGRTQAALLQHSGWILHQHLLCCISSFYPPQHMVKASVVFDVWDLVTPPDFSADELHKLMVLYSTKTPVCLNQSVSICFEQKAFLRGQITSSRKHTGLRSKTLPSNNTPIQYVYECVNTCAKVSRMISAVIPSLQNITVFKVFLSVPGMRLGTFATVSVSLLSELWSHVMANVWTLESSEICPLLSVTCSLYPGERGHRPRHTKGPLSETSPLHSLNILWQCVVPSRGNLGQGVCISFLFFL